MIESLLALSIFDSGEDEEDEEGGEDGNDGQFEDSQPDQQNQGQTMGAQPGGSGSMSEVESEMNTLGADIETLQDRVSTLEQQSEIAESNINDLEEKEDELRQHVQELLSMYDVVASNINPLVEQDIDAIIPEMSDDALENIPDTFDLKESPTGVGLDNEELQEELMEELKDEIRGDLADDMREKVMEEMDIQSMVMEGISDEIDMEEMDIDPEDLKDDQSSGVSSESGETQQTQNKEDQRHGKQHSGQHDEKHDDQHQSTTVEPDDVDTEDIDLEDDEASEFVVKRVDSGLQSEVVAMQWMDTLIEKFGYSMTLRALRYYTNLGWLSEEGRKQLTRRLYLYKGVDDISEEEGQVDEDKGMPKEIHEISKEYLKQLAR